MPTSFSRPADLPIWDPADPGDIDDPGAKKTTGWLNEDLVPHEWMNWQWNLDYLWFQWIDDVVENSYAEQHDLETGAHGNITATDLIVTSGDFQVDADGDVTLESVITNGGKFSVTNNGAIFAANGDFQVSDAGFVRATLMTVDGNVRAENYLFANAYTVNDRLITRRFFVNQPEPLGTGTIQEVNALALVLDNGETGKLLFTVPLGVDIKRIKIYKTTAQNDIDWELEHLDYDLNLWLDLTGGPVDGTETDVAPTTVMTIEIPDTNSPNYAGQGVHISGNQNYLAIKLLNNDAVQFRAIAYEVQYYVSNVVQALQS